VSRQYENPPIIEAICEFRFKPRQDWDWTIPGLVYDKIKADFPKKRQQNAIQLEVTPEHQGPPAVETIAKLQFLTEDETSLVQLAPNLISVNHLKPYPKWPTLKHIIGKMLLVYREIAEPSALQRIGLRYINIIDTMEEKANIEDYLLAQPHVPNTLPQVFVRWGQRVEIPFEETDCLLILQTGSTHDPGRRTAAFVLDLDFVTLHPETVPIDSAMDWVERAHTQLENAFEACITNKARTIFTETKEVSYHA
jgi:uncharacterized protein (TIGR04255 family)